MPLRQNIIKTGRASMTETMKLEGIRRPKRAGRGAARNVSALLVNSLDSKHILGVEEIRLPDGTPGISGRGSFAGGVSGRESWPLPGDT